MLCLACLLTCGHEYEDTLICCNFMSMYVTKYFCSLNQVFVSSKDNTRIPVFVLSKRDLPLDGSHPTLLYGYGGFNISITPTFSVGRIVLMLNLGVVICIANIRGGGEYGEMWHKAGSLENKQNCFDDFISAAEYLVSAGYTLPKRLCIEGGSNGGLLVGACINQVIVLVFSFCFFFFLNFYVIFR